MAADEASSDNGISRSYWLKNFSDRSALSLELPKSPCHSRRTRKIAMSEPDEDEEMPMPSTPAKGIND